MNQCRVCAARPEIRSRPEPGSTAALLLRVWRENDGLRARLVPVTGADAGGPEPSSRVAHGEDAIAAAVRTWLAGV